MGSQIAPHLELFYISVIKVSYLTACKFIGQLLEVTFGVKLVLPM